PASTSSGSSRPVRSSRRCWAIPSPAGWRRPAPVTRRPEEIAVEFRQLFPRKMARPAGESPDAVVRGVLEVLDADVDEPRRDVPDMWASDRRAGQGALALQAARRRDRALPRLPGMAGLRARRRARRAALRPRGARHLVRRR